MVLLYRSRLLLYICLITPLIFPVAVFYPILVLPNSMEYLGLMGTLIVHLLAAGIAITGLTPLLPGAGASMLPWGKETSKGPRWEIAGLAQLPGTRPTATPLTRRVLTTVPPRGAVIVTVAGSEALRDRYVSVGFTAGPERRVHMSI